MKKIVKLIIILIVFNIVNVYSLTILSRTYTSKLIDSRVESNISIAFNKNNFAVAYGGNSGAYYAYFDTSLSNWKISIVEQGNYIGRDIKMQIDTNGIPHLCYTDWEKQNLKYAYYDNIGWHIQVIDDDPMVGEYCSLQLDKNQYPHICYYDANQGKLKYIYFNGSIWKKEIIDEVYKKMIGLYISFKIDKNGNKHISYYDATDDDLKYAFYNGTIWQIQIVDSTGITGLYTSLDVDKKNLPHISYFGEGVLKYAYKNEYGIWKKEPVDLNFGSGRYKSKILFDEENNKYIFYLQFSRNVSESTIRYLYYNGNKWELKIFMGDFILFHDFDICKDINNEITFVHIFHDRGIEIISPEK